MIYPKFLEGLDIIDAERLLKEDGTIKYRILPEGTTITLEARDDITLWVNSKGYVVLVS